MYKSLLDTFTEKQIETLRTKMWWVADQDKPYLVKFAIENDFLLLEISDLRSLWATRLHIKTLLQDKAKFAKSLEIKDNKDLLTLFQSLLSTSDGQAVYLFKEQGTELNFTFKKRIQIYDFSWVFKLQKTNCNPVELICRQILTPLTVVLQAQSKRIETMRKRFQQMEKDYIRKMTEMEKNLYKSPLLQDHQDWQLHIPKICNKLLIPLHFDKPCQFMLSSFLSQEIKKQQREIPILFSEQKQKPLGRKVIDQRYELAENLLNQQLESERIRLKKEKKIDFI